MDVVFVLDSSTSVGSTNFQKQLDFVVMMLENVAIGQHTVRVGLLTFSTTTKVNFHLNTFNNKQMLLQKIRSIQYEYGNTNTAKALRTVREEMFTRQYGDREGVRNIAVVVTDGISNIENRRLPYEAEQTHNAGIRVIAIGVNLQYFYELDTIASEPLVENKITVTDFDQLWDVKTDLFETSCLGISTNTLYTQCSTCSVLCFLNAYRRHTVP